MAVPKRKTSPSRKGMRQQRQRKVVAASFAENPDTGTLALRHHASREPDGSLWYRGRKLKEGKVKPAATEEAVEA